MLKVLVKHAGMHALNVFLQRAEVEVGVSAVFFRASVFLPCGVMNLNMLLKITLRRKSLRTVLASERFVTGMNLFVPNKVAHLGEGLVTILMITLVRSFAVMNPLMLLQR